MAVPEAPLWIYLDILIAVMTAAVTLVMAVTIVRQVVRSNRDVLTSRIFLRKEQFITYFTYFGIFVAVYGLSMGVEHLVGLFHLTGHISESVYAVLKPALHLISMTGILLSVVVWYVFLCSLDFSRSTDTDDTDQDSDE